MGGKRRTKQEAYDFFKERGLTMLDKDAYLDTKAKNKCKCLAGHEIAISLNSVQQGYGCKQCAIISKKKTPDEAYDYFKERGITMLNKDEYDGVMKKNKCKCFVGHEFSISLHDVQRGIGCKQCWDIVRIKTPDEAYDFFKERGLTMLNKDAYLNTQTKNKCLCSNGHEFAISLNHVQQGIGCKQCWIISMKKTPDEAYDYFKERGLTMLNKDAYDGVVKKNKCTCQNGHDFFVSLNNLQQGRGCPHCVNKTEARAFECFDVLYETEHQFASDLCPGKKFDMYSRFQCNHRGGRRTTF